MKANELRVGNYLFCHRYLSIVQGVNSEVVIVLKCLNTLKVIEFGSNEIKPIPITEEWLLKFGFDNWGLGTQWNNEFESYVRYVRHNDLDGTSNFEIHYIKSTYGNSEHYQYFISCDEDDRLNWGEDIEYIHQLQNLYFALTGKELTIKNGSK